MNEVVISRIKRLAHVFGGPVAVGLLWAALELMDHYFQVPIPAPGVLFLTLLVVISLGGDILGTALSVIVATVAVFYTLGNDSVRPITLIRLPILFMSFIFVSFVVACAAVLALRWRLVKALNTPVQAERSLFQAIMASMHDAIIETDWKGIRDVNASFCRMTGFSREELIGSKPPYPFWPIEQYASIANALETSMRGQALDFELVLTRKDGERFPVLLSVSRIVDAAAKGSAQTARVIYSFRNITEIKRAQEILQQQSRELEAAKEAAEIANRTKDRFLGLLSHELRSPLTPILTLASILEQDPRLSAEVRQDLATIRRNAEMEARLIDDLLELVRLAKGTLPPNVDLSVRDVAKNVAAEGALASAAVIPQERAAKLLKILLVEDHADSARVLARILVSRGHAVVTVSTMHAAIQATSRERFDFLVSDIGLPDGSGHELMRHLAGNHPIPAIALSGFGESDDIQRSRDAGFLEHLTKPVNFQVLSDTIERLAK